MKDEGDGSGMSRAAQKRAKKRKKRQKQKQQSLQQEENSAKVSPEEIEPVFTNTANENKKRKHEDKPEKKHKRKKKKKSKKGTQETQDKTTPFLESTDVLEQQDEDVMVAANSDDNDDDVVESVVSKLNPAQILLLQEINEDSAFVRNILKELSVEELQGLLQDEVTSSMRARCLLQSLLGTDTSLTRFYGDYWEKKPFLVQANGDNAKHHEQRFNGLLSLDEIRKLLDKETLCYGRDLNVTKYDTDDKGEKRRVTLDLLSNDDDTFVPAQSNDIWSNYNDGCTVRLLCPQLHFDSIHSLLSTLELEWSCMVGANVYLTPPHNSQGFAPHYDDVEAIVLQLEGYKHWKVYPPANRAETLPRSSSRDFTIDDMKDQTPVLDVTLGPGDLLYMPRGWSHQAHSKQDQHSLHLTVSAMQNWSWVDLLEILLPQALEAAAGSDTSTSLRQGLPRNFLNYMGVIHENDKKQTTTENGADTTRNEEDNASNASSQANEGISDIQNKRALQESFREEAKKRIMRVCREAMSMVDPGCDQIGKRFLSDRLPPALTPNEMSLTSECPPSERSNGGKVWPNTLCRLVRPGIARLALEDDKAVLYHCMENSRVYQGNPLSPMEFEMDDAPALEALLTTVEPHWIRVQDLVHDDIQDKMEIAQSLYDEGILAILQGDNPENNGRTS